MMDAENKGQEERKTVRNAVDLQKLKLEKLFKNVDKPVHLPEPRKERQFPSAPEFVRNVMGSSAGAGSGEFHVYRHIRRREYARQKFITEQAEREDKDVAYLEKLEANRRQMEERTAKKRAKRQKRKNNLRKKKQKTEKTSTKTETASSKEVSSEESDGDSDNEQDDANPVEVPMVSAEFTEQPTDTCPETSKTGATAPTAADVDITERSACVDLEAGEVGSGDHTRAARSRMTEQSASASALEVSEVDSTDQAPAAPGDTTGRHGGVGKEASEVNAADQAAATYAEVTGRPGGVDREASEVTAADQAVATHAEVTGRPIDACPEASELSSADQAPTARTEVTERLPEASRNNTDATVEVCRASVDANDSALSANLPVTLGRSDVSSSTVPEGEVSEGQH